MYIYCCYNYMFINIVKFIYTVTCHVHVCTYKLFLLFSHNFLISLVELGIKSDSTTSKGSHLFVYEEFFEEDFLKQTETFYTKESVTFLANNPVTEYLKRVKIHVISAIYINYVYIHVHVYMRN